MLRKVTLKNFKLHASTELDLRPITVFIGPNNSGKSSVFQALLALKQAMPWNPDTRSPQLLDRGGRSDTSVSQPYLYPARANGQSAVLDLGSFADVLRAEAKTMVVGLGGAVTLRHAGEFIVDLSVSLEDNLLASHRGRSRAQGGQEVRWEWDFRQRATAPIEIPWSEQSKLVIRIFALPNFSFLMGDLGAQGGPTPSPEGAPEQWAVAGGLAAAPSQLLRSLRPVYPLRGFEEWGFPLPDEAPADLAFSTLPDRAVALSSTLAYKRALEDSLSGWLEELAGVGIKFELVRGKRVTVRTVPARGSHSTTLFSNEGTGTNQLPFILVPIAMAEPGDTILISEPEAHLHPKLQVEIARLLLRFSKDRHLQFLIETHSEHVLHAFLHAVATGQLAKDDLAIYYFENDAGTARARPLAVDEGGRVKGGLPGFFDQSLAELTEYLDALKKA